MGRKSAQVILAAALTWPALAQDYTPVAIPGQIIGSPETMTPLNGGDDSTRLVELGFPFQYFGQTFTSAYVSTNGFVSFGDIGNLCCNGSPMEQAPRNAIYANWSDLISGPNPYYRTDGSAAVFGWYATNEYGSSGTNTFEIALFSDGKIQWNYADVNNQWHMVSAGLTGPTMADSISLFYGQNVNVLDGTSYVAIGLPSQLEPEQQPFAPIDVAPSVAPNPVAEQAEQIEEQQAEQAVQEAIVEQEIAIIETAQETTIETTTEQIEEVVAAVEAAEEAQKEADAAERLSPDEVAALAAGGDAQIMQDDASAMNSDNLAAGGAESGVEGGQAMHGPIASNGAVVAFNGPDQKADANVQFFQREAIEDAAYFERERTLEVKIDDVAFVATADAKYAEMHGEQTTTETVDQAYIITFADGPTFLPPPVTGMVQDQTSPSSQFQQMELLNMGGLQTEMAEGQPQDIGDVNSGDAQVMVQLAAVPVGYGAYTQARIPDAPFYQPREIYRNRRIPDANLALYRMMSGQDAKWSEMVGEQYD